MNRVREPLAKAAVLLLGVLCIGRALTAPKPEDGAPMSPTVSKRAYATLTSQERKMRRDSALDFPGDAWSQDDDFHSYEDTEIRRVAAAEKTRIVDVLQALDDGMKEGWLTTGHPNPKVPPCRPRLAY